MFHIELPLADISLAIIRAPLPFATLLVLGPLPIVSTSHGRGEDPSTILLVPKPATTVGVLAVGTVPGSFPVEFVAGEGTLVPFAVRESEFAGPLLHVVLVAPNVRLPTGTRPLTLTVLEALLEVT